jgi:hypothetical protein
MAKASLVLGSSVAVVECGAAGGATTRAHASLPAASAPPCSARATAILAHRAAIPVREITVVYPARRLPAPGSESPRTSRAPVCASRVKATPSRFPLGIRGAAEYA